MFHFFLTHPGLERFVLLLVHRPRASQMGSTDELRGHFTLEMLSFVDVILFSKFIIFY